MKLPKFDPVKEPARREICTKHRFVYIQNPLITVKKLLIDAPVEITDIEQDGNCVFRAILKGIGASADDHLKLRKETFKHLLSEEISTAMKGIYKDGFDICLAHRDTERRKNQPVCGIAIHAAASLLAVDILVHWEGEDGRMEWMLGTASLKPRRWATHQLGLRWVGNLNIHEGLNIRDE